MSTLTFADTHNMVAFLEKPAESDGFHEIIDFLNANQIRYALTVNPTIYTSCIEQFWATAKAKTVNGERQIQALIDKKKVIITETSIRSDLHLEDAGGTDCLPTATIFEELARMGYEKPSQKLTFYKAFFSPQWKFLIHTITQCLSAKSTAWNEFSSTMASLIICLATNQKFNLIFINQQLGDMSHHKKIYVNPSHSKKTFANMRREGKDFSRRVTPLFETMMGQANQEEGSRRKQRKDTTVTQEETQQDDSVPTPSNDLALSGEDSMQLFELMLLCTNLQKQVLDLEKAKDAQAKEIADLKKRVQKVESSEVKDSLGNHEDASKQGRSIEDFDKDADVSLVDDTKGRLDDAEMFDTNDLHGDEVDVDMPVVKGKKETEESSKGTEDELESDKSKKAKGSEEKAKGGRKKILGKKRAGKEQQQESSKKQKMEDDKETDEHEEVEVDDEAELKKHLVIVKDDDIAIDAIPLATKPLDIDKEDLQTLWKLVKAKHGDTRPEDEHERVLWGDLKVMFEPDIKSDVWRNLQGYTMTI
ncbi:hypothetical protein Tco_0241971 [Tanacetum coccineum]